MGLWKDMRRCGYGGDSFADMRTQEQYRLCRALLRRAEMRYGPYKTWPKQKRGQRIGGIKTAVRLGRVNTESWNGGTKFACYMAGHRGGYARQRNLREKGLVGPKHPIHAIRKLAWYKKRGEKRLREEAERRKRSGLPPKPRVSSTLPGDDQRMHAFRPPLPRDAVPFNPPAVRTDVSRPSKPRSNYTYYDDPWLGHDS